MTTKTPKRRANPGFLDPEKNPRMAEAKKASGIRREVAQASAIVQAKPLNALAITFPEALTQAKDHIGAGLQALTACVAMKDLSPAQVCQVHDYVAFTEDAVGETKKFARGRVLSMTLAQGTAVGETGASRELDLGNGLVQRVTIQKQGLDPKKFEAALRAKGAQVQKYMDSTISYKLKEGATSSDMAVADGLFTADEVETLKYEPSYRVDRSKEAKS